MIMVTIFAWCFGKVKVIKNTRNNYCLALLSAGVLVIWFDSVLYEYNALVNSQKSNNETNISTGDTSLDAFAVQCLTESTNIYQWVTDAKQFLYSFNVEFSLLAAKTFLELFFHKDQQGINLGDSGFKVSGTDDTVTEKKMWERQDDPKADTTMMCAMDASKSLSQSPLSCSDDSFKVDCIIETDLNTNNNASMAESNKRYKGIHLKAFVLIIVVNLVFVLLNIMSFLTWVTAYLVAETLYWALMIVFITLGFKASWKCKVVHKPLTGLEVMVIFCSMGIFCYDLFGFYSILATFAGSYRMDENSVDQPAMHLAIIGLFQKVCNYTESYLQPCFLIYAR